MYDVRGTPAAVHSVNANALSHRLASSGVILTGRPRFGN